MHKMIRMDNKAKEYQAAVSAQLDEERRRTGKTINGLAEVTTISRASIERYLKARRDIPLAALVELSNAMGVSVVELIMRAEARLHKEGGE